MAELFRWFILFWVFFLFFMFAVGGYFMFRKFLKRLPKEDGKSIIDWQEYYIEKSLHLWTDKQKALLNDLVAPVPNLFRDIAKQKIGSKIGEIALQENASEITEDHVVRGYIIATPKRDHKFLIKTLNKKKIDITPYKELF